MQTIEVVLDYLQASHRYYTAVVLPRLDERMEALTDRLGEPEKAILQRFYGDYRRQVDRHFAYEERKVFPYVRALLAGVKSEQYSILKFEDNHSDIESALGDLRSILTVHLHADAPAALRDEAIEQITAFQDDLRRHTAVEDDVLVPLAGKLEKK